MIATHPTSSFAVFAALALACSLSACDREAAAERPAPGKNVAKKAKASGTLVGKVTLDGDPPARKPLARDTDPVCARTPRTSEDVVTGANGGLRDVHVRIAVGSAGEHSAPSQPVRVIQDECMYTPRVVGVMVGQKVAIENGDPTYHNVRGAKGKRTLWNLGQPPRAPAIVRDDLGAAGEVVSLHCDVHPWMRAYAVITDHPYFDVTDDSGAFSIADLPAGKYTLEAWHPTLGTSKRTIELEPGAKLDIDFQFTAP